MNSLGKMDAVSQQNAIHHAWEVIDASGERPTEKAQPKSANGRYRGGKY